MTRAYYCPSEELDRLKAVLKRLYGDGTVLSPDARRDLAHIMQLALVVIEALPVDPVDDSVD